MKILINFFLLILILFGIMTSSCNKEIEKEVVVIETTKGKIIADLFDNVAPKHVEHIKKLIQEKFYDSLYFHRVIPGFMIQTGDPNTRDENLSNDGMGQPNQPTINAEFSDIPHKRGILSMARKMEINSASSQFFIVVSEAPHLDGKYSVFGKVIEGMDVVDMIVNAPRDRNDNPLEHIYMRKVYMEKRKMIPSEENEKK